MLFSEKIDQAIKFAAAAHDQQYRHQRGIPYVSHCYMVGLILSRAGFSDEVVMAGILHDVVEDTPVQLSAIESEFGQAVAEIVRQVSDPPNLPFRERKQHQIKVLSGAPVAVKAVKAADILHNLYCKVAGLRQGEDVWQHFDQNKEEAIWGYRELLKALSQGWDHELLAGIEHYVHELEGL